MSAGGLRRALDAGGIACGVMLSEFGTLGIARIAQPAGAAFMLLDQEHTAWSSWQIRTLLAAARATGIPALVRVPSASREHVAAPLDAGAAGIMVPMVEEASEAAAVVACAKYPPEGRRGFGALYADQYAQQGVLTTLEEANREVLVIAQIETAKGLRNVDRIAAVDGVDVLWLGQFDLTISLGIPGQFDHPQYLAAVQRFIAAADSAGKPAGIAAPSGEQAQIELGRGYRCVALDDVSLFEASLRSAVQLTTAATDNSQPRQPRT